MEKEKSSVVILYNEDDIKRGAEVWAGTEWRKKSKRARITAVIFIASFALAAVLLACGMMYESAKGVFLFPDAIGAVQDAESFERYHNGETTQIAGTMFWAAVVFIAMLVIYKRTGGEKGIAQKRYESEMKRRKSGFLPRELTFEENGVRTKGRNADFVIGFDEIEKCCEFADGIFLQMNNALYLWIPARFFDAESAEGARNTLKGGLGKNYINEQTLVLPEQTERPEKESPAEPEGDALIEFYIDLKKGDLIQNGINSLGVKRLLFILLALFVIAVFGRELYSSVKSVCSINPDRTVWDYILKTLTDFIPMLCFIAAAISILKRTVGRIIGNAGKAMKWNGSGAMYENIIVRECPSGKSIMPWDKVDVSTIRKEGLYIISLEIGSMLIPTKEVLKRGEKLVDIVNEQMQKHHHHDGDCCCEECAHEHEEAAEEEQE